MAELDFLTFLTEGTNVVSRINNSKQIFGADVNI